jgi:succinate dehydrogenase / fumarate reductase cytochrome b subunit
LKISDSTYHALRRLHSLSGVVPLGLFLLEHFYTNSVATHGAAAFNHAADDLARIPYVLLLEIFGIALPLLFHMILGIVIATTAQANVTRLGTSRNWMYLLQRVSGVFLAFYIVFHVWSTRLSPAVIAGNADQFAMMNHQLQSPLVFAFYALGVLAASFHFGNGLFGFAIHWGLVTGARAQRAAARVGFAVFLALSLVGLNALLAFVEHPVRLFERAPAPATTLVAGPGR